MRTIRFRGMPFEDVDFDEIDVHIKDYEFVYGNLIVDGNKAFIVNGIVECSEDNLQLEQWIRVRPETVGQYVGLNDKNGKEIFEGDIIEPYYSHEKNYVVKFGSYTNEEQWEDNRSGYGYYTQEINDEVITIRELDYELDELEVISNIHIKGE